MYLLSVNNQISHNLQKITDPSHEITFSPNSLTYVVNTLVIDDLIFGIFEFEIQGFMDGRLT